MYSISNRFSYLLLFIGILGIYIWSLPASIVLEDDGYFVLTARFNGVAHPPGYPLYILLAHVFSWIPFETIAWRVHFLSAVLGTTTCVFVAIMVRYWLRDNKIAVLSALMLAFSDIFWSQSIIAEVYTLNTLLFFISVYLANQIQDSSSTDDIKRLWCWFAMACGLGISNHWPLFVLSSPLLACLLLPKIIFLMRHPVRFLIFFLIGLLPYVWMVIRSNMNPEISFIGPIMNWSDFWFHFSREGYAIQDDTLTSSWWDKWQFILYAFSELSEQFGPFGIFFILIGFIAQWFKLPVNVSAGLTLAFLGNTLLLILLLGFDYDLLHQNIFRVYPMIAYAIAAIWLGMGVICSNKYLAGKLGSKLDVRYIHAFFIFTLVPSTLFANLGDNYRRADDWAETYAQIILNSVETNAVIFTYGDFTVGPLGYLNLVKGVRPDVSIYNTQGLVFNNRLFRPYRYSEEEWKEKIKQFIDQTDRPVYYLDHFPNPYGNQDYGLMSRVDRQLEVSHKKAKVLPGIIGYFRRLASIDEPVDPWEAMHHRSLIGEYCQFLSVMISQGYAVSRDEIRSTCSSYLGSVKFAGMQLASPKPDWDLIDEYLENANRQMDEATNLIDRSLYAYYRGEYFRKKNLPDEAYQYYRISVLLWPGSQNSAWQRLENTFNSEVR